MFDQSRRGKGKTKVNMEKEEKSSRGVVTKVFLTLKPQGEEESFKNVHCGWM